MASHNVNKLQLSFAILAISQILMMLESLKFSTPIERIFFSRKYVHVYMYSTYFEELPGA